MRETVLRLIEGLGLAPEAVVLLLAMLPIFELRGSVPVGILLFRLPVAETAVDSIVGNMLPILPLLFLFERVYRWLSRYPSVRGRRRLRRGDPGEPRDHRAARHLRSLHALKGAR